MWFVRRPNLLGHKEVSCVIIGHVDLVSAFANHYKSSAAPTSCNVDPIFLCYGSWHSWSCLLMVGSYTQLTSSCIAFSWTCPTFFLSLFFFFWARRSMVYSISLNTIFLSIKPLKYVQLFDHQLVMSTWEGIKRK